MSSSFKIRILFLSLNGRDGPIYGDAIEVEVEVEVAVEIDFCRNTGNLGTMGRDKFFYLFLD